MKMCVKRAKFYAMEGLKWGMNGIKSHRVPKNGSNSNTFDVFVCLFVCLFGGYSPTVARPLVELLIKDVKTKS